MNLRNISCQIVTEKLNSAYSNVLKEEYDKKISILCKESNQTHKNIASEDLKINFTQ